jgi:hypothetical protein
MHLKLLLHSQHRSYTPIQPAFAHTLAAIAEIMHIDPQAMASKLNAVKINIANASLESAEALQTTRSRLELCFSRRWR